MNVQLDVLSHRATRYQFGDNAVALGPFQNLDFEDTLDSSKFMPELQDSIVEYLGSRIAGVGAVGVEGYQIVEDFRKHFFSFSTAGQRLLDSGGAYIDIHKESGRILPQLKDSTTGKIIEQAKGKHLGRLAKAGRVYTWIVLVANVISGFDNARRLRRVESNIDFLLASQRVKQIAKLESIYVTGREATFLSGDEQQRALEYAYRETLELRIQVRRDLEHRLERVKNPDQEIVLKRLFPIQRRILDSSVVSQTLDALSTARVLDTSILFQMAFATKMGRLYPFLADTLPHEVNQLWKLVDKLWECESYVRRAHADSGISVGPAANAFQRIVSRYERFCIGYEERYSGERARGVLPESFPHLKLLNKQGIYNVSDLHKYDSLREIDGIGRVRANEIEAALANVEPEQARGTLPKNFPFVKLLKKAGIYTAEDLYEYSSFEEIQGIGKVRAQKVESALSRMGKEGDHRFDKNSTCMKCGRSKKAIEHFEWPCT